MSTADERTLSAAILFAKFTSSTLKGRKPVKNADFAGGGAEALGGRAVVFASFYRRFVDYSPKKTPISRSADSGESDA